MQYPTKLLLALLIGISTFPLFAQSDVYPIANELKARQQQNITVSGDQLFQKIETETEIPREISKNVSKASFFRIDNEFKSSLLQEAPEVVQLSLVDADGIPLQLELFKADFLADEFQVNLSSGNTYNAPFGLHYWGTVNGSERSLVAISIGNNEVMGFIAKGKSNYVLGKVKTESNNNYILYNNEDYQVPNPFTCDADPNEFLKERNKNLAEVEDPNNCVQMYVEIDNDLVVEKGSATAATDYVLGAFSQVAMLYANESVDFKVKEIYAWNTVDPYTGSSTSDFLYAFRDHLNGNYNGDLAHLVGTKGGGGVAYIDVLCNKTYGVGYSDINLTYSQVPNYSWTVEVITHEIGHNLGSRHTHDCVWNSNNSSAIDGCGEAAGYGNGCTAPIPESGTIMSYCHLVSGVGIDFNLGFGPQPGDLIRNRVYNSSCLTACAGEVTDDAGITSISVPNGSICETTATPEVTLENFGSNTLSSVTIEYYIDNGTINSYTWTGTLATGGTTTVYLPSIAFSNGSHSFSANTLNPNGTTDSNPSNDGSGTSFTSQVQQTYYADADGDGYGDPASTVLACSAPAGYVANSDDCDDTDATIYPGGVCDDGDPCTENDVYDSNCNCAGTPAADSDGDGVCDALDVCPGGDDTIDTDGDGIPDDCNCNATQGNFPQNPLTHSGNGSSSTAYNFASGDKNVTFTVSDLEAVTKGNPKNRFDERVVITYVDGNGNSQTYGTYTGSVTSSVSVNINGIVQSVAVTLDDAQSGGSNQLLDVSFGPINYCTTTTSNCPDSDNDGVCDAYDVCPGGDDNIDTDGDGIPDFCDPSSCTNTISSVFSPDPLVHMGSGSSTSMVSFPLGNVDVNFTITDLNAVTNGKPDGRFIDKVTVTYVNGAGNTIVYGTYYGDQQSSANVTIAGAVQSTDIILEDGYDGNSSTALSVNPSDVSSCVNTSSLMQAEEIKTEPTIYPNPARDKFTIAFGQNIEVGRVEIFDYVGKRIAIFPINEQKALEVSTSDWPVSSQFYLIRIDTGGNEPILKKVVIQK